MPTQAIVEYGKPLSEAVLIDASGKGSFVFLKDGRNAQNDKPGHVKEAGYNYTILYTPANENYSRKTGSITVNVIPKHISVNINDASKVYSEDAPSFSIDEDSVKSQLEEGDTVDGLKVELASAGADKAADVGKYPITGKINNSDYTADFKEGTLTVTPCPVGLKWDTTGAVAIGGIPTFTYSGEAINVKANISNLASRSGNADDCSVQVLNGKRTNVGSYTAVAIKLKGEDAKNYTLSQEKNLSQKYAIKKADPVVSEWPSASLTYGQSLGEATLSGGEANTKGTFRFVEQTAMPSVADSGVTNYEIEFIPDDSANYNKAENRITVTVAKRPVTLLVANADTVYGNDVSDDIFSWTLIKGNLVNNDKLAVDLKFYDGDKSLGGKDAVKTTDAGKYSIGDRDAQTSKEASNENYEITIREGDLNIQPRPIDISWSDTSNIIYNKPSEAEWNEKGANVTATISNLVSRNGNPDDCSIVVEGGNEKAASLQTGSKDIKVYKAIATGLTGEDSENYVFEEEKPAAPYDDLDNSRIKPYVIRRAVADYILPQNAVIVYGTKLGDITNANMVGASGDGDFVILKNGKALSSEEQKKVLNAGTYKDYQVQFVPKDTNLKKSDAQDITLVVTRAKLTVSAENKEKTYGDGKPNYTVKVSDETPLKNGDKSDELMTLKSVSYEYDDNEVKKESGSGDEVNSPAGVYDIVQDEVLNKNYRINFIPGRLTVNKREVKLEWSDTSKLVYTGKPVNVEAVVKNLVNGDECNVTVVGGDKINAGDYTAFASEIDNYNYALPQVKSGDFGNRIKNYTIEKANPNAKFPKKASLSKGAVLGSAKYDASCDVPGTFMFENPETIVNKAGSYKMIFTPDDEANYNSESATVEVEIISDSADGSAFSINTGDPAMLTIVIAAIVMALAIAGLVVLKKKNS